ncbi:hypothetical protein SCLCIDRAFT_79870, partial [Scleroderma citrinum Foug A]
ILEQGYNDLENTLTQLVDKTSLTPQQIMDGWHKSKGQAINRINHWNLYTKYFAKHEAQERRRLAIPADVLITPTTRGQLYNKFKEENGKAWQEVLELHDLLESSEASSQTIAYWQNGSFHVMILTYPQLEGASAKHGFEMALVMCSKVVNEDASLGFIHSTAGAK